MKRRYSMTILLLCQSHSLRGERSASGQAVLRIAGQRMLTLIELCATGLVEAACVLTPEMARRADRASKQAQLWILLRCRRIIGRLRPQAPRPLLADH